jgi:hypothetical protein
MAMSDDDHIRDAMLFRFWCRAASYPGGWPSELAKAFNDEMAGSVANVTPDAYRRALTRLAQEKGINFP